MSKSPHILNTASNLLGFCLVILTSIKVFGKAAGTFIDEIDAVAIFLFITSCLFSFLSMRQSNGKSKWLENIAEVVFLAGLSLLLVITILFTIQSFK